MFTIITDIYKSIHAAVNKGSQCFPSLMMDVSIVALFKRFLYNFTQICIWSTHFPSSTFVRHDNRTQKKFFASRGRKRAAYSLFHQGLFFSPLYLKPLRHWVWDPETDCQKQVSASLFWLCVKTAFCISESEYFNNGSGVIEDFFLFKYWKLLFQKYIFNKSPLPQGGGIHLFILPRMVNNFYVIVLQLTRFNGLARQVVKDCWRVFFRCH